jgi:O-antigen ligase
VQHRLAAWKAGFEIMRDYPFGVGWNKTLETYQDYYSPPPDGAAAITTNDYLMLGTQLGWPGLLCFVAYVVLCLGVGSWKMGVRRWKMEASSPVTCHSSLQAACRAGALAMLVTFGFDGGLFKLATAAVFWILLELGAVEPPQQATKQTNEAP